VSRHWFAFGLSRQGSDIYRLTGLPDDKNRPSFCPGKISSTRPQSLVRCANSLSISSSLSTYAVSDPFACGWYSSRYLRHSLAIVRLLISEVIYGDNISTVLRSALSSLSSLSLWSSYTKTNRNHLPKEFEAATLNGLWSCSS
jgi:hypothetical protein